MIERRVHSRQVGIETRADGKRYVSGYAAVFHNPNDKGTEYEMFAGAVERVGRRAFERAMSERQDVVCTVDHEERSLLGRTSNGTCRLTVDEIGLRYEAVLPNTTAANDVAELIARGDIPGSSFSFIAKRDTGATWERRADGVEVRTLVDVDLIDVGPVTHPAYRATTASARDSQSTLEAERAEYESRMSRDQDQVNVMKHLLTMNE